MRSAVVGRYYADTRCLSHNIGTRMYIDICSAVVIIHFYILFFISIAAVIVAAHEAAVWAEVADGRFPPRRPLAAVVIRLIQLGAGESCSQMATARHASGRKTTRGERMS